VTKNTKSQERQAILKMVRRKSLLIGCNYEGEKALGVDMFQGTDRSQAQAMH